MKYIGLAIRRLILPYIVLVLAGSTAVKSLEPYLTPEALTGCYYSVYAVSALIAAGFFGISIKKLKNGENISVLSSDAKNMDKDVMRATYPVIPDYLLSSVPREFVVGKQGNRYICIPMKEDGLNTFCVGTPGAGKSILLKNIIIANTNKTPFNYFLIDIDGLICNDLLPECGGYDADKELHTQVIDVTNRSSYGWDVFYQLRGEKVTETRKLKVVTDMSEALIEESGDNPYFSDNARKILTGVLLWGIESDMDFVLIIHRLMRSSLDELLVSIVKKAEENGWNIILDKLKSFCGKEDNESLQDIEATLKQKLDVFSYPDIEYCLRTNPNKTSPAVLDDASTNLVFAPPTEMLLAYAPIFRLITMQVLKHCESVFRVSDERRTCLFIDEAARIGKVDGIADLMATGRKYHVNIFLFYQDMSQFRDVYGKEKAATITNLCELKLFLSGSGDQETTEYLANMVGDYTTTENSYERSKMLRLQSNVRYSEERRPIIDGQTMMQLRPKGELIAIYFGSYYRFEKVFYFKDKKLKRLYESFKL